jgi:site-specific recombinase XerD
MYHNKNSTFTKCMKEDEDMFYSAKRLDNALGLLRRSKKLKQKDKKAIRDFVENLKARRVSTSRIGRYVYHLRTIGENLGCRFEAAKRKDIENFLVWLNSQDYAPDTISDFEMMLKRFYKFLRHGNLDRETPVPEEVRWISTAIKPSDKKQPRYLTPQEVEKLVMAADCIRDKAMISVGFEGGFRACELLRMNVGSISFDEKGALASVRGKTGGRVTRLIASVPILTRHLETHSLRNDPEAPLWTSHATNYMNQRMKWAALDRLLKRVASKAGLNKTVYNKQLRHGSATQNAKFLTDSELKIRYGWSMSSRMPAVYIHLSSADLDDKLLSIYHGKPIESRPQFVPVICARCQEQNSPGTKYCGRCGSPLSQHEIAKPVLEIQDLREEITELREIIRASLNPKADQVLSKSSELSSSVFSPK